MAKTLIGVSAPSTKPPQDVPLPAGMINNPGYFVEYTYSDGSKELRYHYASNPNGPGVLVHTELEAPEIRTPARTPEKKAQDEREEEERKRNAADTSYGFADTNAERAKRQADEQAEQRAQDAARRQQQAEARQQATADLNAQIAQQNYELAAAKFAADQREPKFLSQAGESNPFIVRQNTETGQLEQISNPNYDAVKVQGERLRQQLATQIQARQVTLDEAKQQYSQWFDSNVKIPMMQAQEARDRAAEQRAALDAEERRKQFAANFGLQKAELGQRAGEAAMTAEQSLLPYRAGPTEAAEMSSAINSLAAGGTLSGPSASAGINFTPGAFQFQAPDFKKIAKDAAKSALSGLTDYKPAEGSYQTADYSGVGAINPSGAPSIPQGYGDFQDIIDQLKNTYQFGGQ